MLRAFRKCCKYLKVNSNSDFVDPALSKVKIDYDRFVCPKCKARGRVKKHGFYKRNYVYLKVGKYACKKIKIRRVKCKSCKSTHAVLPLTVVPYCVFSIMFIAALVRDYNRHIFPSMEALAKHYEIPLSTLVRLMKRFAKAVRLFYGVTAGSEYILDTALILSTGSIKPIDSFLESYLFLRGRSFCEP